MQYAWHDAVGNLGVLLVLGTYAWAQTGRLAFRSRRYSVLNALGAALITLSLCFEFNLSGFLIEASWVVISLYGLARRAPEPG